MEADYLESVYLAILFVLFFGVNLHNVLKWRRVRKEKRAYAEVESPGGLFTTLAIVGTLSFFFEAVVYIVLTLLGFGGAFKQIQLAFGYSWLLKSVGLILIGSGVLLFVWSVVVRGRYSVSWAMTENHVLVTWGPYRYVRHPSYAAYFLMFSGLFPVTLSPLGLIPLVAIPGYVRLSSKEEELLTLRFEEKYVGYRSVTGRFLPKVRF
ncbi:isoprenylcysteine carboxylmethyltransferase family protein [Candidatus Bathyarchaeota archaeon]|nr:isoprenylcysteine carboxylmethyltransferase family protein [Candidatus Bathyarchaeota archaeon]